MENSNPSISRREFAALSAGAAGALLGTGTAESQSFSAAEATDRYEFLLNHVEDDHRLPTLVRFSEESGFEVLDELSTEYRRHDSDPVAAYAKLVPEDARTVIEAAETDRVEYTPGSNPFWKLGDYDERVFPDPEESVDFIALAEALSGVESLEQRHEDRLRVRQVGSGAGHENRYEETTDPREVWGLELTENVGDRTAFAEKDKLVFVMSVHGDERAGVEAGLRFVEEVLAGDRPAVEAMLSEFVLVFLSPNPAGWVVREPIYEDPANPPDFRRYNAVGLDPNRQCPTAGWILPDTAPGEPDGRDHTDDRDGVDGDVPDEIAETTPATLAMVDYLRSYENVEYLLDLHGMYSHTTAVTSLVPPEATLEGQVDAELFNDRLASNIESELGSVEEWGSTFGAAIDNYETQGTCRVDELCEPPTTLFDHGSVLDVFGYTAPGAIDHWAAIPTEKGGLGATALTLEIVFANSFSERMVVPFLPSVTRFHVDAYGTAIATAVEHAGADIDTRVTTNDRSTAYVTTDALTRSSADLPHTAGSAPASGVGTSSPVGGEYRHETRVFGGSSDLDAGTTQLLDDHRPPDPEEVLGYQQRPYEVTPLAVFDTVADSANGPIEAVSIDDVREGVLVVDDTPTYDNLVVCHSDGLDETYSAALTAYAEAGGNLVLTDAGVEVAARLDIQGLENVERSDITRTETRGFRYREPDDDSQPLFIDRKGVGEDSPLASEPWNYPLLGYARGQAPGYGITESSFGDEVRVASSRDFDAQAATVPVESERVGVHLLGSLLPPAEQGNLHPFGLREYAVTLFGYTLLCNALGYRLDSTVDGEQRTVSGSTVDRKLADESLRTSTPTPEPTPKPTPTPELTPTADATPERTPTAADGDGAGFGPLTTLAGAGSAAHLLYRRLGDSTEQDESTGE